jgi:RHS repeat-associated protein
MRRRLLVLLTLALTLASADALAVAAGRTPGGFDVTSTGEATYTIPVAVPPGVNGLAPQLALTYASRSRQSIAGWGWNISGAMAITRCNSTVAQDGAPHGVDDTLQDRFCLNGNKLRLVSGTYGVAGSEYRTEIETFSRIKAYGSAGNGPGYFVVEGKDGLIYEFGRTTDSLILSRGRPTARSWALNQVRDRDSNAINYSYHEDLYGAYRLEHVTYGGNSLQGTPAIYSIDLIYEARPQEEVKQVYFGGSAIREYNRLDRIDVLHNNGTTTTLYRRYDLTYEPSLSAAKHSRLASVVECAGPAPDCLPQTTFTYENSPGLGSETNTGTAVPVTSAMPLDVNGDGREDLVYPNGTGPWMVMFANGSGGYNAPINTGQASTGSVGAIPFDYDNDGKADLLVPYSGGTWWVLYGTTSGLLAPQNTGAAATATGTGANARALDVDGDGQDDLVWADLNPVQYGGGDVIRWRRKIPGGGFSTTVTDLITPLPADQMIPTGVFGGWAQKMTSRVPDFNGDGRDDLAFRKYIRQDISALASEASSQVEGTATTTATWKYMYRLVVVCPGVTDCLTSAGGVASEPYFGDFNGDGLTDLFYFDGDGNWKYRFSNGTGFEAAVSAGSLSAYLAVMIVDWDGDGYDDVLMDHTATTTWHFLRSTGDALSAPVSTGVSSSGTNSHVVTDMNGDGLKELAYRGASNTWRYKARPVTLDYQDQLITATDGFGVSITFNYAPITVSAFYAKGTGSSYPLRETQYPLWIVGSLSATDGTGNGSTYTLTFTYESGRLDMTGRGFVGFAKRTIVDSRLNYNIKTIETYRQDFPFVGALASVEQQQASGSRISLTTNSWAALVFGTGVAQRKFPYLSVSQIDEHELSGTKFRNTKTTVTSISSTSGLILDSNTVTKEEPAGSSQTERVLYTSPLDDITNWCLGRPTDTAITSSHTLANGVAITRSFDATWDGAKCRPTQRRIEPDNATWRVTVDLLYDNFGNVNSQTVTGGGTPAMLPRTTLIGWGTDGHFPRSVTNALNQVTNQVWNDAMGRPSSLTDPNGIQTSWTYDSFGRPDTETRQDGTKQKWTFGNVCGTCGSKYRYHVQVDELVGTTLIRRQYSYLTQLDQVFLERVLLLGSTYSITASRDFDARGRLTKQFVPYIDGGSDQGSRRWTYDRLDRVLTDGLYSSTGTLDRETTYSYSGLESTVTDPLNHATKQTLSAWGDLLSVEDALNGTVSHEYNAFGELKKTTDAANNVVATVSYIDVRGLRTELDDMNLGKTTFGPNALGEVVSQRDANHQPSGTATTFEYDKLGRMTKRTEPDGTISNWTWGTNSAVDEIGRLKKMDGPGYLDELEYDTVGRTKKRKITVDGTLYQFDFGYNSIGELDTVTYPASTGSNPFKLDYEYNNGYLSAIRDYTGNVLNTTFWALNELNARGQPISEAYGNGLWLQSDFKALTGEMDTRKSGTGGSETNVQNLEYTWDTVGNFKTRRDLRQGGITDTANYDALNRLTQMIGPGGTLTVAYDAIGNVTSRSDIAGPDWTYDTNKKNAVTVAGPITYNYDANGNMTSRNGVTQTWTSGNLPATLATSTSTTQVSYAPDRSRWKQVANYVSGQETTLYIGGLLEKQTMPSPLPVRWKHRIPTPSGEVQYVRYGDINNTSETFYLPSDHAGSVDAVLNSAGTVLVRTSFDAWGARRDDDWVGAPSSGELQQIANATRNGFTGHEMLDNVGLVHMNGRVYDAAIGRFMSADPFVIPELGTQGLNRYAYVGNQPLTYVDPSGFIPISPDSPDDDSGEDFDLVIYDPWVPAMVRDGRILSSRPIEAVHGAPYGWLVPYGDHPKNGGAEEREFFSSSQNADSINVSTVGRIDTVGLLLSRGPIVAPYEPLFRDNFAGHVLQSLDYSAGILAAPFRDGEVRGLFSNQYPNGRELMDAKMGLVLAAAPVSRLSGGVSGGTSSLFRAVGPAELADIQSTGVLRSIAGLEGKYFTTSAEAASSYARQAVRAFGDPPYTLIRVDVSNRIFRGLTPATVDSGIPAWVIPNSRLPGLSPQVLDVMPVPGL